MRTGGLALVGRSAELDRLEAALDRAAAGAGATVVVTGEAGIGKTSLLEALARRAEQRGFTVALGRCAPSESPPYWPWPRVLRALGGPGAGDLPTDPATGRAALFAAAADRVERASTERPVLLAVDDWHWAEESALALGSFLLAAAAGLRVAVVLCVRDEPGTASTPLADLPADVVHLRLGGLDTSAAAELVDAVAGRALPPDAVADLHARTGGNPLFLRELAELVATGEHGRGALPDRVRQVLTRRVARASPAAYATLAAAAVADDFDVGLLAALVDGTEDGVAAALAEAVDARLVLVDEDGHRFVHDLVRQTVLDLGTATQRVDLHRRAATFLESRRAAAPLARRADLARRAAAHWVHVPGPGRDRAAALAAEAARGAADQLAYDDAARLYDWARRLGDDSLETLTALGEAQILAGRLAEGRATLAAAADRAAAAAQGELLARAVLAAGAGAGGYEVDLRDVQQVDHLRLALGLLPAADRLRPAALARLALVDDSLPDPRRVELVDEGAGLAARLDDPAAEVGALAVRCDLLSGPDHVAERLATTARMIDLAARQPDPVVLLLARRHRLLALLEHGDVAEVDEEVTAYARTADHLRVPLYSWIVPVWRGMRALMDGDRRRAEQECDAALALGRASDSPNADVLTASLRFAIARGVSSTAVLEPEIQRFGRIYAGYPAMDGLEAVHRLLLGDAAAARTVLRQRMAAGIDSIPRDAEWLETLWNLAEVAAGLGELDAAAELRDALAPYAELWAVDGIGAACYGVVAHQLGVLDLALGRGAEAARWLEVAETTHLRVGAAGLAAMTAAVRRRLETTPTTGGPRPAPRARSAEGTGPDPELVRDGPVWRVSWRGRTSTVRHSKGVRDLARLLERPGQEVHALDLVDPTGGGPAARGTGPALDDEARRAYRDRLSDLDAELDEATAMADEGRVLRLEQEREALVAELTRAFGLGGRARPVGDAAEQARKAVGMRIATAIRAISAADDDLGRHLERSVDTGRYCCYRPEQPVRWRVSPGAEQPRQDRG